MLQFRFLNFTSIPALFCVFFLFACSQNIKKGSEKENLVVVLDSLLNEHSFVRNTFDPNKLELLAGNSELGGLISSTGLGFDSIWCSDLWANKEFRTPLQGVKLVLDNVDFKAEQISAYSQKLSLKDGVVITNVQLNDGTSFETEVFFSAKSKRVLGLKIKNHNIQKALQGKIRLPEAKFKYASSWPEYAIASTIENRFQIQRISDFELKGVSSDTLFTQSAWNLKSDKQLKETNQSNQFGLDLEPGSSQTFFFSFVTKWQSNEFQKLSDDYLKNIGSFDDEKKQHIALWDADWAKTPLLILPEKEHEKLFYQSVYWLFCTSGSEQFLPGEAQFAGTCWNMKPFTYGAAGWATLAYMHLGHFDKAKKMLINHYKPEGLLENSKLYITIVSHQKTTLIINKLKLKKAA